MDLLSAILISMGAFGVALACFFFCMGLHSLAKTCHEDFDRQPRHGIQHISSPEEARQFLPNGQEFSHLFMTIEQNTNQPIVEGLNNNSIPISPTIMAQGCPYPVGANQSNPVGWSLSPVGYGFQQHLMRDIPNVHNQSIIDKSGTEDLPPDYIEATRGFYK